MHRFAMPLLLALSGLVWVAAPAVAAEGEKQAGSILVIMDVSGSMRRSDAGGTTLIAGARRAVSRLVADAPCLHPGRTAALRQHLPGQVQRTGLPGQPARGAGGPVDAERSTHQRSGRARTPHGLHPHRLLAAAGREDFRATGQRTIVLVSDGEDTCGKPTPCQVAKRLGAQGIDVRVDTVGLFLQDNRKAQAQLRCVAASTGGKYYAADIRPGEARFYSFPAGTGQVVASTLTEDEATEYGCCLKLAVLDPEFNSDIDYNNDGTAKTMRVASDDQGVADDGTYTLQVALDEDTATRPVRFQFKVGVTGTALGSSASASPSPAASPTASDTASPTAGPTASPSAEPSAESSPSSEAGAAAAATAGTDGTRLLWTVLAVLFVLVLVAVAALGYALTRLRRRGAGPTP